MSDCTHDCSTCGENCSERQEDFAAKMNPLSNIKHVIAILSGKGGVGKSLVCASLAAAAQAAGYKVGILDGDITGPSIPKALGVHGRAAGDELGIYPMRSEKGIEVMSLNLLTETETDPVVWRGPVIAGAVTQFWTDVIWGELDYLFVDMPPGTGDVPLTVFQSLPVDGAIVVTSPQDLVSMIVTKAVKMAQLMKVPLLGVVENYSYFKCPDCGKEHRIFGDSKLDDVAEDLNLPILARIPIDPKLAQAADNGALELFTPNPMADVVEKLPK